MITQQSIDNLKNHLDVVDTVSSYVQLKKAGANYKGLCPFHGEDTPSFVVSPQKQIYHCFGCGAGGDSIKFVMELEKLSYPEAIEKLARENNITLEYEQSQQRQNTDILVETKEFYKRNLEHNQIALNYLKERGVYESSIEEFEIGYAPQSHETINYLRSKFYNMQDAIELGVLGQSNNLFARFIERIIFPIYTPNGSVTGFGGRTITGHQAKYVNSPQSKVFNKSKLLYGYSRAKEMIYKKSQIIITEGYLDVIMLHQAGFKNATATLGTALTNEHVPLISKGDPKVILAYDGDKAGLAAAYKASRIMASHGKDGGVVIFGEGMDPADMVNAKRIDELNGLFNHPKPFIAYILEYIVSQYQIRDHHQKQQAIKEVREFFQSVSEFVYGQYRNFAASILQVDPKFITRSSTHTHAPQQTPTSTHIDAAEASLIKTASLNQSLVDYLVNVVDPSMFKYHYNEYLLLLQSDLNNPALLNITLNDEVKLLEEKEFFRQINIFMSLFYQRALNDLKYNKNISSSERSYKMRDYMNKIQEYKQKGK
jgi:DNA primase